MPDRTVITPLLADTNGLEYFEIVFSNWGDIAENGALEYRLPNVPLTGLAIGPASTISEVAVDQDYSGFVGRVGPNPDAQESRVELVTTTAQDGGGAMVALDANVSVGRPYVGLIAPATKIIARTHTRFDSRADAAYWAVDGSRQGFTSGAYAPPLLQLRCYVRAPGPVAIAGKRAPLITSVRKLVPAAVNPYRHLAIVPISGRKHVSFECWALPDDQGVGGGSFKARASFLRGGYVADVGGNWDTERSQLFEEELVAETVLTENGATNVIRGSYNNPGAEWLMIYGHDRTDDCYAGISVRASD
jgi:hypothetical protein